ncbi:MAG: methyltransferase domain-containing protein [Chitinophagales bacterium]|nr:methyltransferase domain-containing protein [Chitinophagales bacterium]
MSENKNNSPENEAKQTLDQTFWENRYVLKETGWDLGEVSPPLKAYIDQLTDKNLRILIPGCGNTYEAEYLLNKGFTNITVIDISPTLINNLKTKFKNNTNITIVLGDFFALEGAFDLIIEQTFFCALDRSLRQLYCEKMNALLSNSGKLVGLLFNREFEAAGPPFGGCEEEYRQLFSETFEIVTLSNCYNSYFKRANAELFTIFMKKKSVA